MTDKEMLEKIIDDALYSQDILCELTRKWIINDIMDSLKKEGITFKKKREYIRKSPCKCGASNQSVFFIKSTLLKTRYGGWFECRKCGSQTLICKTKKEALIEWNKMNEVKE